MRAAAVLFVALVVPACSKPDRRAHDHLQPEATLTGTMPQHMRLCPSAVPSAQTSGEPTKDGVDITITSQDLQARAEIISLAVRQSNQDDPLWLVPHHSGMHGGPGTMGHCPIIHANTHVTYSQLPDGVRIHVAARNAADVPALQKATEARLRALTPPSS